MVATVGASDDKSLVSWVVYKGVNQKDRIKTYLEHGSVFTLQLNSLPEGKSTIFGYGKEPSENSTKVIINRKHNKLEGITMKPLGVSLETAGMVPKRTPVEPEDTTLTLMGALPDKKSLTIQVKSLSASSIVNKGA